MVSRVFRAESHSFSAAAPTSLTSCSMMTGSRSPARVYRSFLSSSTFLCISRIRRVTSSSVIRTLSSLAEISATWISRLVILSLSSSNRLWDSMRRSRLSLIPSSASLILSGTGSGSERDMKRFLIMLNSSRTPALRLAQSSRRLLTRSLTVVLNASASRFSVMSLISSSEPDPSSSCAAFSSFSPLSMA